ncbi:kelch repeat and BTB domain-containing protein [Sesbania bispinosa]|nr:kelch repeat and BTB domain-containing protein [Sesbania bispinosa]
MTSREDAHTVAERSRAAKGGDRPAEAASHGSGTVITAVEDDGSASASLVLETKRIWPRSNLCDGVREADQCVLLS